MANSMMNINMFICMSTHQPLGNFSNIDA